jgi:hypothetical protein
MNEYDTAELECQEENWEIPPCDTMVNCYSRELSIFNKIRDQGSNSDETVDLIIEMYHKKF